MNRMPLVQPSAQGAPVSWTEHGIYERLVSAILDQRLLPGTKLVEDRLAQAFGVSRTRVRPALVRLAHEHLVHLRANRGAVVAEPTPQEGKEVFEARRLIEPSLLRHAMVRASEPDLDGLRACVEAEQKAEQEGNRQAAIRLSGQFHLVLARISGQTTLARMLEGLVSRTSLILMAYGAAQGHRLALHPSCGCRGHRALLDALRLRLPDEAVRLMDEHLWAIEQTLDWSPAEPVAEPLLDLLGLEAMP